MAKDIRAHSTTIEVSGAVPPEVAAGAGIVLKVKVSCTEGCDLHGLPVEITPPNGAVVASELITCDAGINETADITLKAPQQVGEHVWTVAFAPSERDGVLHEAKPLSILVQTKPHMTSL